MDEIWDKRSNPYKNNLALMKKFFAHKSILVLGLLYLASALLLTISTLALDDVLRAFVSFTGTKVGQEFTRVFSVLPDYAFLILVCPVLVTTFLLALSYILLYFKSNNQKDTAKLGFSLAIAQTVAGFKVIYLFNMAAIFAVIVAVMMSNNVLDLGAEEYLKKGVFFLLLIADVVMCFQIVTKLIEFFFVNRERESADCEDLSFRGANFTGRVNIVVGFAGIVISAIGIVAVFIAQDFIKAVIGINVPIIVGIIFFIGCAIYSVCLIILGKTAIKFRDYIKAYTNDGAANTMFTTKPVTAPDKSVGYSYKPQCIRFPTDTIADENSKPEKEVNPD